MRKGWFKIDGVQDGDRTLEQQLEGLRPLVHMAPGKSVLDVGCAEGLVDIGLHDLGARVHGIDVVVDHIGTARLMRGKRAIQFDLADANTYRPTRHYDIVLMLAILHKLKDPVDACLRFAEAADEMVVIRLPPLGAAPKVMSSRGPCSIPLISRAMNSAGWKFFEITEGSFGEWTSYWKK